MPESAHKPYRAVVIGASAGGLKALSAILPNLPADYPLPIMVVIHVPPHRRSLIAPLFEEKSQVRVVEAEDKTPIEGGCVFFAPPDYHLLVERSFELSLSSEAPVLFSRPSIDVLFETAADAYGDGLIGVILTGANNDGAEGLKAVMAYGGKGLIQTPATAFSRAMPEAAIEACPSALILDLDDILLELKNAA
ncbi:chemotaxis protein CheB [Asticcacaulis sp. ZE23SCel15]|uniref:chemotaxis protein CheB n=1 Tax=Asticcacaulis sp. ZE23SCel15 TaxID=3059027 RepID=UPI00265E297F|nr:chemotaxis protein CheB [Asticcacaulis sp. ZE23SCel15]WKL57071.1 chemotaxis protein CheB [Asticcacaulis sp. ZE23SCel15]